MRWSWKRITELLHPHEVSTNRRVRSGLAQKSWIWLVEENGGHPGYQMSNTSPLSWKNCFPSPHNSMVVVGLPILRVLPDSCPIPEVGSHQSQPPASWPQRLALGEQVSELEPVQVRPWNFSCQSLEGESSAHPFLLTHDPRTVISHVPSQVEQPGMTLTVREKQDVRWRSTVTAAHCPQFCRHPSQSAPIKTHWCLSQLESGFCHLLPRVVTETQIPVQSLRLLTLNTVVIPLHQIVEIQHHTFDNALQFSKYNPSRGLTLENYNIM